MAFFNLRHLDRDGAEAVLWDELAYWQEARDRLREGAAIRPPSWRGLFRLDRPMGCGEVLARLERLNDLARDRMRGSTSFHEAVESLSHQLSAGT
ncbi:MAG: hypothetical protein ACQGVC_05775 [Myxococcota bacterium]